MLFKTAYVNTVQDSSSEELFKNTVEDGSSGHNPRTVQGSLLLNTV